MIEVNPEPAKVLNVADRDIKTVYYITIITHV